MGLSKSFFSDSPKMHKIEFVPAFGRDKKARENSDHAAKLGVNDGRNHDQSGNNYQSSPPGRNYFAKRRPTFYLSQPGLFLLHQPSFGTNRHRNRNRSTEHTHRFLQQINPLKST
jgi:hypothetical protein